MYYAICLVMFGLQLKGAFLKHTYETVAFLICGNELTCLTKKKCRFVACFINLVIPHVS